jgi:hypothetical protein
LSATAEEMVEGDVTIETEDHILDGKYVDVAIIFPKCEDPSDCQIEYDPDFSITATGDGGASGLMIMNLVLLVLLVIALM